MRDGGADRATYPTDGLKWIGASRLALLIFSLFAIVTIGLAAAAFGRLKLAQTRIGNQSPQLRSSRPRNIPKL